MSQFNFPGFPGAGSFEGFGAQGGVNDFNLSEILGGGGFGTQGPEGLFVGGSSFRSSPGQGGGQGGGGGPQNAIAQLARAGFADLQRLAQAEQERAGLARSQFDSLSQFVGQTETRFDDLIERSDAELLDLATTFEETGKKRVEDFLQFRDTELQGVKDRAEAANQSAADALQRFSGAVDNFTDTIPQEIAGFNRAITKRFAMQEQNIIATTQPGPIRDQLLNQNRAEGNAALTHATAQMATRFEEAKAGLEGQLANAGLAAAGLEAQTGQTVANTVERFGEQTLGSFQQEQQFLAMSGQARQASVDFRNAAELNKTQLVMAGRESLVQLAQQAVEQPVSIFETMASLVAAASAPGARRVGAINPTTGNIQRRRRGQGFEHLPGFQMLNTRQRMEGFFPIDFFRVQPLVGGEPVFSGNL